MFPSPLPYVLHAPPIPFFLVSSPDEYMAMSTDQLSSWIRVNEKMAGEVAKHGLDLIRL